MFRNLTDGAIFEQIFVRSFISFTFTTIIHILLCSLYFYIKNPSINIIECIQLFIFTFSVAVIYSAGLIILIPTLVTVLFFLLTEFIKLKHFIIYAFCWSFLVASLFYNQEKGIKMLK